MKNTPTTTTGSICAACAERETVYGMRPGLLAKEGKVERCPTCNPRPLEYDLTTVYTRETRPGFFEALGRGDRVQVDQQIFDWFLDILPPVFMGRVVDLIDGSSQYALYGFAEGAAIITAFWSSKQRFYAQYTNRMSRG
jgi:hypothetical protein